MASHIDDDFEVIDVPSTSDLTPSKHDKATCRDPFCQLSHVSREDELASDRAIEPLVAVMQATAADVETKGPVFHASAIDRNLIFDTFVGELPLQWRRVVNCNACKHFLQQYGGLCVVGEDGGLISLVFPSNVATVPQYYKQSVQAVLRLFVGKSVGDEFKLQKDQSRTLGFPTKGGWNHMSVTLEQVPAVRPLESMNSQDTNTSFTMLDRILKDNSAEVIKRTHHIIHENQLPYAESHKAPIAFLHETAQKLASQNTENPVAYKNLITKYARSTFPGCISSLRGGMLGYLLECVNEGQDFETLKKNWMNKADPLSYMRPTAVPSVGNIESAERIFARMGYTPRDLERVFLTLDQVPQSAILWTPSAPDSLVSATSSITLAENEHSAKAPKLFGHLLPSPSKISKGSYEDAPLKDISFRQFILKVLPTILTIEVLPPNPAQLYFFTTGKPGTKPIMSFHSDAEGSHTASWYAWGHPNSLSYASLQEKWTPIKAIITFPHMWDHLAGQDIFDVSYLCYS